MTKDQYDFVKNYLERYLENIRNKTNHDLGQPLANVGQDTELYPTAFIFPHPEATEPSYVLTVAGGSKDEFLTNLVVLAPMLAGSHIVLGFDSYSLADPENASDENADLSLEQRYFLQEEGNEEVTCCIYMMGAVPSEHVYHVSSSAYREMEDGKIVFTDRGIEYSEVNPDDIAGHLGKIFMWLSAQLKQDPTETVHTIWSRFLNSEESDKFFKEGEDKGDALDAWSKAPDIEGAIEIGRQIMLINMMAAANWKILSMSEAESKAVLEVNRLLEHEPHDSEIVQCLINAKLIR